MKNLILFLLLLTSVHSISIGQSTPVPTSILDLEKLIDFDKSQYENYVKINGFFYFKAPNGNEYQTYKTAQETTTLIRRGDSTNWSLDLATNSEEQFYIIKNSLYTSGGYKLKTEVKGVKIYKTTRNSCEVLCKNWDAGEPNRFSLDCGGRLGRSNKQKVESSDPRQENPFLLKAKYFREYIEVGNPQSKDCYYDIYINIPYKIDELTEKDFYTLTNNKYSSIWFDSLYDLKQLIVKAVNPATGKEELTDRAKYALLVLNEIRPPSIPIVKFVQMLQEIGDKTKDIRATLRKRFELNGDTWKCN